MGAGPQVIVEKMIEYLRTTTDDIQKADVVKRLGELAERFAPDTQWFIDTMNQVRQGCSQWHTTRSLCWTATHMKPPQAELCAQHDVASTRAESCVGGHSRRLLSPSSSHASRCNNRSIKHHLPRTSLRVTAMLNLTPASAARSATRINPSVWSTERCWAAAAGL